MQTQPISIYYGLKVNQSTLIENSTSIAQVVEWMEIDKHPYVVGLDTMLSKEQQPHYHIHWTDNRTIDALRKRKQRCMKWGHSTKLYTAKIKPHGDVLAWFGYAVKEKLISHSDGIDLVLLNQHAHTQKAFKQSQLNYGADKEAKKEENKSLEDRVFEKVKTILSENNLEPTPYKIFVEISRAYMVETEEPCRKSNLEHLGWKFMFKFGYITHEKYVSANFRNLDFFFD